MSEYDLADAEQKSAAPSAKSVSAGFIGGLRFAHPPYGMCDGERRPGSAQLTGDAHPSCWAHGRNPNPQRAGEVAPAAQIKGGAGGRVLVRLPAPRDPPDRRAADHR